MTYQEALQDIQRRVKASGTSFAVGMRVLPRPRREAMYALYAFCREVDDIADDSPSPQIREEGLSLWHRRIKRLFHERTAEDSITTVLLPAIDSFSLIEKDFQDIIDGMDMDARETICAPSMAYLDTYCDHVASAVGRVSVRLFGDNSEPAQQVAHHLGRALQLTNILRDLAEDATRGRLYLPEELLAQHNITSRDPQSVLRDPLLPAVCRDLAAKAQEHFQETDKAMALCLPKAMRPAQLMRNYYLAILKLLLKKDWQQPESRISLPFWQKLWFALQGLLG